MTDDTTFVLAFAVASIDAGLLMLWRGLSGYRGTMNPRPGRA